MLALTVIGPATIAFLSASIVVFASMLFVFIRTGVFVNPRVEASFAGDIVLSDTVATACDSLTTVIKSIVSVDANASAKVIVAPETVYAEFGFCITPLTETIIVSGIRVV
jgi:hypothetical protein